MWLFDFGEQFTREGKGRAGGCLLARWMGVPMDGAGKAECWVFCLDAHALSGFLVCFVWLDGSAWMDERIYHYA